MNKNQKVPVGVLGATGMVGQRFIALLKTHPWFEVVCIAASKKSAGKTYEEAVAGRWMQQQRIPTKIKAMLVHEVEHDAKIIAQKTRLVFSAIDAEKEFIQKIEEQYASLGVAVVSNNSAHRWTNDIPMIMPEINPEHLRMIDGQRKNRDWTTGLIVTKPNCSIQCYVPVLHAWKQFKPQQVIVSTYQAISGAGKTFATWPEMIDNVIPYINGEEEKSEKEPSKIWATVKNNKFYYKTTPKISASCIRVPVTDGHMATLNIQFATKATKEKLIAAIRNFKNPLDALHLPSAPKPFLTYFEEDNRPQTRLDRDLEHGMGISIGRLREDPILGWKCVTLAHNTLRGAAKGSILNAELLLKKGYIK